MDFVVRHCLLCHSSAFGTKRSDKGWHEREDRRTGKVCFVSFFAFFFVLMFFGRTRKDYGVQLVPFSSYYWAFAKQNTELFLQCIMNVLLHVALGFLLPCCYAYFRKVKKVLAATLIYSLCVELLQGILQIGYFEVDDVINSLFGALAGIALFKLVTRWHVKKRCNQCSKGVRP